MSKDNNSGSFIYGLLIGSVVGAVTGLVLAPRNGKQTRQILKKTAEALPELAADLSTNMQRQADRISQSTLRNWDDTLLRLKESIVAGMEASQQQQQMLSRLETPKSKSPQENQSLNQKSP